MTKDCSCLCLKQHEDLDRDTCSTWYNIIWGPLMHTHEANCLFIVPMSYVHNGQQPVDPDTMRGLLERYQYNRIKEPIAK